MDDKQLIAGCLDGNRMAQRALYDLYAPKMLGICLRYVGDREIARDILQEGFVKIFLSLAQYKNEGPLGAWMRRIFINEALNYIRKTENKMQSVDIQNAENIAGENDTPISKMSADDLMQMVRDLPTSFRSVFNLYAIEGYSHREIAEMLHIEENTSRSKYARARQILQGKIKERYDE